MTASLTEDFDPEILEYATKEELAQLAGLVAAANRSWRPNDRQAVAEALAAETFELLYGGAAGGGKALKTDIPVPTPAGWTTMGDLADGDLVLGADGSSVSVLKAHPAAVIPGYRLTFNDGSSIEASGEHLWRTFTAAELAALTRRDPGFRARRRAARPGRVGGKKSERFSEAIANRNAANPPPSKPAPTGAIRTTDEIAATLRLPSGRANHAVPVAACIDLPEVDLPLDPWVLGAWLGDGSTSAACIAIGPEDAAETRALLGNAGFETRPYSGGYAYGIPGLGAFLRAAGVFGNKHIPLVYLRASAKQRLALLQGLMDTDGHACESGAVEFTSTNQSLADGVRELALSLGHKAAVTEGRATLNGVDKGPKWRVKWSSPDPPFRLTRKLARWEPPTRRTTRFRYIVACEPIEPVPMRCITVASSSGMFLAGRAMIPTHNSEWLLKHPEGLSRKHKNHRTLWLRRDYPRLRQSAIDRIEAGLFDLSEEWQWKERDHRLIHRDNRSLIQFGHMQNEQEFERYLSSEWDCICIDEATELNKNEYLKLTMRARTSRAKWRKGVRPHMALGSNPGSMWLKERFVDPLLTRPDTAVLVCEHDVVLDDEPCDECAEMRELDVEPLEYRRAFVPAKVGDNPHVDPVYAKRLNMLPPRLRAAYRDGNWDVFEGQFFGEWDQDRHVVEPFEIPESWPRLRAIDYGQAAPYACLWIAFDENSRAWVYRETYGPGRTARQQGREIQEASVDRQGQRERYRKTMADPSIFSRQGSGQSIAADYRKEGITPKRANNERVLGANRVRDFLAEWDDGKPGLQVFSTCRNLIRTLPQLVHDKNNPEDVDSDGEDHAYDALRYGLMTKAPRSRSQKQPDSTMQVIRRKARRSAGSHDHSVLGRY